MSDDTQDTSTRTGLWVTFTVVAVLLVSVLTWQVRHSLKAGTLGATAAAAASDAGGSVTAKVEALADELLDVPLTGDIVGTLYFASGEAGLPANAAAELEKVRQALDAAPNLKVVLSGFHDASGDPALNAELAKERAKSARDALKALGIAAERIKLRKPEQTLADGSAQEARRVEMRLTE
jgi:outer membrane protein OmpA-like peptidoglycan-associated protein